MSYVPPYRLYQYVVTSHSHTSGLTQRFDRESYADACSLYYSLHHHLRDAPHLPVDVRIWRIDKVSERADLIISHLHNEDNHERAV